MAREGPGSVNFLYTHWYIQINSQFSANNSFSLRKQSSQTPKSQEKGYLNQTFSKNLGKYV